MVRIIVVLLCAVTIAALVGVLLPPLSSPATAPDVPHPIARELVPTAAPPHATPSPPALVRFGRLSEAGIEVELGDGSTMEEAVAGQRDSACPNNEPCGP